MNADWWLTIGLLVLVAMFVGAGVNEMYRNRRKPPRPGEDPWDRRK